MFEVTVLDGVEAGVSRMVRGTRLPFTVGRGGSDLSLPAPGVWERHFEILLSPEYRFGLRCGGETSVLVNGVPMKESRLKNGDIVQCGAAKLLFSLTSPKRKSMAPWAGFAWALLGSVTLLELLLIVKLR
jgi:FHA domain